MNLIEVFPILATLCLIIGDMTQLGRVLSAHHCRSVSLTKWILSLISNTIMPWYYYLQGQYTSAVVAIVLWVICLIISIIIILRRRNHETDR